MSKSVGMTEGLTWDGIAMVLAVCALAASSITEVIRKLIMQGIIERRDGEKPWWRGAVLRTTSVVSGAGFGLLMVEDSWRLGLLLGIGAGSLTTEAVGLARRAMRNRNGNGSAAPRARSGQRIDASTDFKEATETDFRPALTEEDTRRD